MRAILGPNPKAHHLVVTDCFYTSPTLALQILTMKVYLVGTVMTNRLGFPPKHCTKTEASGFEHNSWITFSGYVQERPRAASVLVVGQRACGHYGHWWKHYSRARGSSRAKW
ncbi:TPA: hypothetical protein N0F65_006141 [Lagenidium giganteum]|uniref:PiggyBac transposable element-derived protein domain-containing protein n=1 Tax=Lagenidium giganteum TaxID=4803 RepID=A0AAV2Z0T5_9STRA|nr:TPA: hypothetical protein N0F65_006141 [Lagenidium giganteum]